MNFWSGTVIKELKENEIFVFGSNSGGIHGAGAAKAAMFFGAKFGNSRGIQGSSYALVTKNLTANFVEKETGLIYEKAGFRSVSQERIRENILKLYTYAKTNPDKEFIISYQYESWSNGSPKKSLNGYTSQEMLEMFIVNQDVPSNIVFHDSYKPHLEKILNNKEEENMDKKEEVKNEYTYFFHLTSPFSNFHPSKFEYKDFTFISNEQFMMFSKAKNFNDEDTAEKIINVHNEFSTDGKSFKNSQDELCYKLALGFKNNEISRAEILANKESMDAWNTIHKKIKQLGRGVKNYDDEVWTNKRAKVVLFGAKEKFSQNLDLKEILLATKDNIMVEASPYDKIWGVGLSEYDAKRTSPEKWPGMNLLGKVLNELKNIYKKENNNKMKM